MGKLAVGAQLFSKLQINELLKQSGSLDGSHTAWLAESGLGHPFLVKRMRAILDFSESRTYAELTGQETEVPVEAPSTVLPTQHLLSARALRKLWVAYAILMAVGIPVWLQEPFIGIFLYLIATIPQSILLYQAWAAIQGDHARTTPKRAVALRYIPFFNMYWIFVAFWGLAKDMRRYSEERSIPYEKGTERLTLIACWLILLAPIPVLGQIPWGAGELLLLFCWRRMVQSTIAISAASDQSSDGCSLDRSTPEIDTISVGDKRSPKSAGAADVVLLTVGIVAVVIMLIVCFADGFRGLITVVPAFLAAKETARWMLTEHEHTGRTTMRTWAIGLLMAAGIMLGILISMSVIYSALDQWMSGKDLYDPNWSPSGYEAQ